ncbi:MAG: sulfotransferase [Deltaproteobacteria bacterium]|nr:sulfotransferase [Deltaproteobacteria bacterium]
MTVERWADRPDARLLLLLSSERSGSTLLRYLLGEHSRLVSPQELFVLRYPDYDTWRAKKAVAIESLLEYFRLIGQPKSEAEIDAACRGRSAVELCDWMLGFLPPRAILIDKTPAYANERTTLERTRPLGPFYVWLIRHPLAVIDSQVRLKEKLRSRKAASGGAATRLRAEIGKLKRQLTRHDETVARRREAKWVAQNRNIHRFLAAVPKDQQCTVYFEDLVRQPEAELTRFCDSIGLEREAAVGKLGAAPEMNPHLGDPNFHQHRQVDAEMADDWMARYSEAWLAPETLALMDAIGVRRPGRPARSA